MNKTSAGFTLVELMVALALGVLLSLAAVQLFATNQRTFTLQEVVSGLQEDGQSVIRYLSTDLRQAGRGAALQGAIDGIVISGAPVSVEGALGANDELVITYFGDRDCQGTVLAGEVEIINRYFVDGTGDFSCSGNQTAGSVVLLPGVESFQVLYGIDGDADGNLGVTQFIKANALGGDPVVAIRFAILLASPQPISVQPSSQTYYVLDEAVVSPSDRLVRRVFTKTVQLRNFDWDGV
tara:strand:+ start:17279 stop:17992 length:714 start_codon:yes stop_codon:yes gene_type:complete